MTDELYLYEVFEDEVTPLAAQRLRLHPQQLLLRSQRGSGRQDVRQRGLAPRRRQATWWLDQALWPKPQRLSARRRSVYLQGGDDPAAYANSHYRQLIANAIDWAAAWAEDAAGQDV